MSEYTRKQIMEENRHQFIYSYNTEGRHRFLKDLERTYPILTDSTAPVAIYMEDFYLPLSKPTNEDINSNPYNIQFTEMNSLNIPQVQDDFDFVVITGSIVYNAGIDASTALAKETVLPHLVLQVVVREDNKDSQWAKDIVAAYHSKEFKDYLEKTNYENGLFWIPDDYEFN